MPRSEGGRQTGETVRRSLPFGANAWVPYALILLPGVLSVAYVHAFGVNVVFRDQWEMARYFEQLSSGNLSFSDVWEPHNEHRFFFPRIAMLALGTITEWNNVAEMYLIQLCLFATLAGLWLAFRTGSRSGPLLFVPVAFMVFTLSQSQNMLWGYQITFAFTQTFSVLALLFLHLSGRGGKWKFTFPIALTSGTVAAFSAIQGLLVWPAGLLQILIAPLEKRVKGILIAAWGSTGTVVWVAYFVDYEPDVVSSPFGLLTNPVAGVGRFLSLLGDSLYLGYVPFLTQRDFAFANGLLVLGLAVTALLLVYKYAELGKYSFWLSLLAFSFLVLLSMTLGRSESGGDSVSASRYVTFSVLATIGVYAMLVKLWTERKTRFTTALLCIFLTLILLNIPFSYLRGIGTGVAIRTDREEAAFVLRTYESQSNESLRTLRRSPESVRRLASVLEDLGYNVFSEPQARP